MNINIPDDPFILELLPEFIDTWITDLDEQYDKLVIDQNEADLYRLAHTLKGSCYQFGIDDLAKLGIELMAIARAHDWEKASQYGTNLKAGFLEVKQQLGF
jgi:hypothetical protein